MKNAKIIFLMLMILSSCTKPENTSAAGTLKGGGEYKAGSSVTDTLISEQENFGMQVIPNYGTNVPTNKLQVLTRYIGDIFLKQGISVTQSGAVTQSGETNMVINTKDLENRGLYKPIVGGGPHIWISKQFSSEIHPWSKPNSELILQMYAEVPNVILTDSQGNTASYGFAADKAPVTQLSFGFYLKDKTSQKTFAYIICVYESRGTYQESAKNNDTFTNFTSSPLESSSSYITKSPLSVSLQSKPFSGQKFFKVHINEKNLLKAISDTGDGMSANLADYQITSAGVLFELPNYVNGGHNTSQVNVSKFTAFIQQSQK